MTENEYIRLENLTRIRMARSIIGQVLPDYGVTKEELREIDSKLEAIADHLAEKIHVEE